MDVFKIVICCIKINVILSCQIFLVHERMSIAGTYHLFEVPNFTP